MSDDNFNSTASTTAIPEAIDDCEINYPPWNFSWVVPGKLAAMAWPQTVSNLKYLKEDEGIDHLITLSPEKIPPIKDYTGLHWTPLAIKEFEPPTIKQILKFIDICQRSELQNEAIGIHCRMGRGRTGVMAACYLIRFQDLTPQRAMTNLRLMRPGSIETPEQERVVMRYYDCLRGVKNSEIIDVYEDDIVKLITND